MVFRSSSAGHQGVELHQGSRPPRDAGLVVLTSGIGEEVSRISLARSGQSIDMSHATGVRRAVIGDFDRGESLLLYGKMSTRCAGY